MKILVCSDSHGDTAILDKIYFQNQDCNLFLHCGDSGLPDYLTSYFLTVKGNCDYFDYPLKRDIQTKWGKIHIEHGNSYRVKSESYIEKLKCLIFFYGHTHVKEYRKIGDTHIFNPGSLTRPRDDEFGSYLIVDIDDDSGKLTYKFHKVDLC